MLFSLTTSRCPSFVAMIFICAGQAFLNELKVKENVHKQTLVHVLKHPVSIWAAASDSEILDDVPKTRC